MKKYLTLLLLSLGAFGQFFGQCYNGNIEMGNFTNWTGYTGQFAIPDNILTPGIVGGRHSIAFGTGLDAFGSFPIVNEGAYSILLGNSNSNCEADMVSYSFFVTSANADFQFKYALVLEDPGNSHTIAQKPDFTFYMKTENFPGLPTSGSAASNFSLFNKTNTNIVADLNNPFFKISGVNKSVVYKNWVCVRYDLTEWVGQTVTIFFKVRDCSLCGHWGYAYIDALCSTNVPTAFFTVPNKFCDTGVGEIYVDGSSSTNEDYYEWKVYETDATGSLINYYTIASEMFYGQQVGILNIQQWYQQKGFKFECNRYYNIVLKVFNQCGKTGELYRLLKFECPLANAGSDFFDCCKLTREHGIGTYVRTPIVNTYQWSSTPIGFSSNQSQPFVNPTQSTRYNLTVTDPNGCKAYDKVDVLVLQPFTLTIDYACLKDLNCQIKNCGGGAFPIEDASYPKPTPCDPTLKAVINYTDCFPSDNQFQQLNNSKLTYKWSTGETTQEITVHPGITLYTVTVSNGCFTKTSIIKNVIPGGYFSQGLPTIAAPSAILPNGTTAQKVCKIYEYGSNAPSFGVGPAYHAYRYRLRVYDRGGAVIYCKQACSPCGFLNGEIEWDGRTSNGTLVANGVYNAQLTLWNCVTDEKGSTGFNIYRGRHLECSKYRKKFLFFKKVCLQYKWVDDYESSTSFKITVIQ